MNNELRISYDHYDIIIRIIEYLNSRIVPALIDSFQQNFNNDNYNLNNYNYNLKMIYYNAREKDFIFDLLNNFIREKVEFLDVSY